MISRSGDGRAERVDRRRASALFGVMVVMVLAALMCLATLTVSTSETKSATVARHRLEALYVAQSGIERQIADLRALQRRASLTAPFQGIDQLAGLGKLLYEGKQVQWIIGKRIDGLVRLAP